MIHLRDVGSEEQGWNPMVRVEAGGISADYLIDTGGDRCTLASGHVGLLLDGVAGNVTDSNGLRACTNGQVRELLVDGVRFTDVGARVLGAYTSLFHGRVIWGTESPMLGQTLFGERIVVIDGPGHRLWFPGSMPNVPTIPFTSFGPGSRHLIVQGRRGDAAVTVFLDTGYARSRIADQGPGSGNRLDIGGMVFDLERHRATVTHLPGDTDLVVGGVVIHVTLGWDVLRDVVQTIDYRTRSIALSAGAKPHRVDP